MELIQGSILELATRLEIGSGLQLTQNADGIAKLDTNPASFLTQDQADVRYVMKTGDTMTGALRISSAGGFTIGDVASQARVAYGSSAFSFLTESNGYADLYAGYITGVRAYGNQFVQAGAGSNGFMRMTQGDTTHTGYLEWYTLAGVRKAYMGYGPDVLLQLEDATFLKVGADAYFIVNHAGEATAHHAVQIEGDVNPWLGLNDLTRQAFIEIVSGQLRVTHNSVSRMIMASATGGILQSNWVAESDFQVGLTLYGASGWTTAYTTDGLFNALARPAAVFTTPNGGNRKLIIGYQDGGGGQYFPAIGILVEGSGWADLTVFRTQRSDHADSLFRIYHSGTLVWGPGTTGGDTSLTRSATGILTLSSALVVGMTSSTAPGTPSTYALRLNLSANDRLSLGADGTNSYIQSFAGNILYLNQQGNLVRIGTGGLSINASMDLAGFIVGAVNKGVLIGNSFFGQQLSQYGEVGYNNSNANNEEKYYVADWASRIRFIAGGFSFQTAPAGSAGAAITFTERMQITASGAIITGGSTTSVTAGEISLPNNKAFRATNAAASTTYGLIYLDPGDHVIVDGNARGVIFGAGLTIPGAVTFSSTVGMGAGAWTGTGNMTLTGGSFFTNNWFRSTGDTGWFNQTYSTGIHSTASGLVRTYSGTSFLSEGYLQAATSVNAGTSVAATTYFYANANAGSGLVGLYDPLKFQLVYAMGDAYKPALNGSSVTGFYGLAWIYDFPTTYINATTHQLEHALLLYTNGTPKSALGMNGIWTAGSIWAGSEMWVGSTRVAKASWSTVAPTGVAPMGTIHVVHT